MVGTTVQHYEILELIGRGAMGTVYKARDTRLDILRALKFLQPVLSDMHFAQAHLLREARTQAKLLHPNVAALLELEVTDDWTFLVMEYVDGPTLDVYLAQSKPPLKERFNLILQVACALDAAHSRGILHRDIKPKNVLIAPDGTAKVTDFGLAKALGQTTLTMSGETKGTAPYMAPEAFRGDKIGATADVWSLGVLAYEVLEGELPFRGESFEAVAYQIVNQPHPPLSRKVEETLPGMSEFVDVCLNKDERERLADGSEAFLTLTGIATKAGLSSLIPALSIPRIHRRKRSRVLRNTAVAALLCIAILAGLVFAPMLSEERYEVIDKWQILANERSPSWCPHGERIAFITGVGGSALTIWYPDDPAKEPKRFTLDAGTQIDHVCWAPSDTLIVLSGRGGIYLINHEAGPLWQICETPALDPSWSSNSRWLIYRRARSGGEQASFLERIGPFDQVGEPDHLFRIERLEILGLEELGESLVLSEPVYILDDTRIAFIAERGGRHLGVYSIPAEGGEVQLLIPGDDCPQKLDWDSRKQALLYRDINGKICSQKITETGRRKGNPQALNVVGSIDDFDFHPTTRKIVLTTSSTKVQIWRLDLSTDGEAPLVINERLSQTHTPMFLHNTKELFYAAVTCGTGMRLMVYNVTLRSHDFAIKEYRNINSEYLPTPDSSGRYILFRANMGGVEDLFVYNRSKPQLDRLTEDKGVEYDPIWSADGRSIFYIYEPADQSASMQIRRLLLNRGRMGGWFVEEEPDTIYSGLRLASPLPGPDDRYLLFQQDQGNQPMLCVLDLEAEPGERNPLPLAQGGGPALSPSRRDVYYIRDRWIYRIADWRDALNRGNSIEEPVSLLPEKFEGTWRWRPLTVGTEAVYVTLLELDAGLLRALRPGR